jgi:hypothetical protein
VVDVLSDYIDDALRLSATVRARQVNDRSVSEFLSIGGGRRFASDEAESFGLRIGVKCG